MKTLTTNPLQDARQLLEHGDNDAAIELLRASDALNDSKSCALLAHAYFRRGDSKGDIYTSHYFSRRARQLGHEGSEVALIQALSAFRREQFAEAASLFADSVTQASPASIKLIYGLALHRCAKPWDAMVWIDSALSELPAQDPVSQTARQMLTRIADESSPQQPLPSMHNMYSTLLDTLRQSDVEEALSPHRHSALSKLKGHGSAAKDFDWVDKNIPCQAACPAGTDIPGYLSAIYRGEYDAAYRINLIHNVFPAVLGRVCARPCETACRHGWEGLGEPVAICWSKRAAGDLGATAPVVLDKLYGPSGKKVAVIGSGVAGLAAARNLALLGHDVTVYEKYARPGGMLVQGIPEFRLPRDIIEREVEQVRTLGVRILCNAEIGKTHSLQSLLEAHHAVIMAAGTLRPNVPKISGSHLRGIRHGLEFLLEANNERCAHGLGKRVIVIGGGFTAMDCARTARRLGTESVGVMYRRGPQEMLITPGELEELRHEGMDMVFFARPSAFLGDESGRLTGVRFVRTRLGEPGSDGRQRPADIAGSEFEVYCDTVLLATGQHPDTDWIDAQFNPLLARDDGWLNSGASNLTNHARIFAAGDFATGARTLIDAIGHAKECVRRVDHFLIGEERLVDVVEISEETQGSGRIREMDAVPRQAMPTVPTASRALRTEVETGYDSAHSVDEAQRCYMCHFKYEIDVEKCIYCEWCLKAKPRPDCIVKVKALQYDEQGVITGFERARSTEETQMIYINQQECIRCNACVQSCPVDAISVQKVSRKTLVKAESPIHWFPNAS